MGPHLLPKNFLSDFDSASAVAEHASIGFLDVPKDVDDFTNRPEASIHYVAIQTREF
jgi:hypothetical protein